MPIETIDYRSLSAEQQEKAISEFSKTDRGKGFNFKQAPLMRITLIQLSNDRCRMVWTFHHILFDGWSMPVLMEEFLKNYEGINDKQQAEDRFEDYIHYIESKDQDEEKAYWQKYLRGLERGSFLPFIDITKERTRAAGVYAEEFTRLDKEITTQLQTYARKHRLTMNTIMQGVWSFLLHRYTNDANIVYGVTVSGRPEDLAGVEKKVGMYINTLPLYTSVQEENSIVEWLHGLQQEQLASRQYQYSALANVQEWTGIKGELFDTILVFENYPVDKMVASRKWKLQVGQVRALGKTNYPLTVLIDTAEEITASFKFNTSILDPRYVQNIASHFRQALLQLLAKPEGRLRDIQLITPQERSLLLNTFGCSETEYPDKNMIDLFERQAKRKPEAIALVCGKQQFTYKELNQRTNQLAHYLRSIGIKENSCVPLCIDKPFEAIVAMLAILKAGGAYVPVDPDSPQARMEYVFADTNSNVILTTSQCRRLISHPFDHIIETDNCDALIAKQSRHRVNRLLSPDHLIYVIYTSGSTGAPKGVMIRQRSIMDYVFGLKDKLRVDKCNSFALVSAIFTDLGNTVIYSSLVFGGVLHVFNREMTSDPAAICTYFEDHRIDCLKIVPSHWKALSAGEKMLLPNKWLIFGGEALHAEVPERIFKSGASCGIVNHYGPTETTIGKLLHVIKPEKTYPNTIPIGKPFSNTKTYVLSASGQLCPLGVPGELFIGGDGVAAGYVNNPALSSEKFVPDPFSNTPGAVMYRTGDVVKYLPDGNILFIGRADNQVKIRGYRVELGEIESVLQQAPGVTNGAVSMQEDAHANKRLIAYVTGEGIDTESVMLYMKSKLPEYMTPAVLMQLPAMPLTANGKIDRRKLPAADISLSMQDNYQPPRNAVETQLAVIWQELLGLERIGIYDNFFELGGNSLLIMRMDACIKKKMQLSIPMQVLFQLVSIDEISKYLQVEMQAGTQEDAGFEIVTI